MTHATSRYLSMSLWLKLKLRAGRRRALSSSRQIYHLGNFPVSPPPPAPAPPPPRSGVERRVGANRAEHMDRTLAIAALTHHLARLQVTRA